MYFCLPGRQICLHDGPDWNWSVSLPIIEATRIRSRGLITVLWLVPSPACGYTPIPSTPCARSPVPVHSPHFSSFINDEKVLIATTVLKAMQVLPTRRPNEPTNNKPIVLLLLLYRARLKCVDWRFYLSLKQAKLTPEEFKLKLYWPTQYQRVSVSISVPTRRPTTSRRETLNSD